MTAPLSAFQSRRQAAMAVLAHVATRDIAARMETIDLPPHQILRTPENGLIMLRGRVGGDGAPFNLGEATVSRAAIRLETGETGFGYVLGRDPDKAQLIALCDAMVQSANFAALVETHVLSPLRAQQADTRTRRAEQTAATRVDFYTLVRGEAGA